MGAGETNCGEGSEVRLRLVAAAGVVATLVLSDAVLGGASTTGIAPKVRFSYTGHEQSYMVPRGVVLLGVAVEGGHGGQ